jgi:hypothetical protein
MVYLLKCGGYAAGCDTNVISNTEGVSHRIQRERTGAIMLMRTRHGEV